MRLLIVRHGETVWNLEDKRFRGQMDIELSKVGLKQVDKTGLFLKHEKIDKILFSPMIRCKQTAENIKKFQPNSQLIEEPLLIDISFGDWEGKRHSDVFSENPQVEHFWNDQPEELVFPNGESWYRVYERVDKFFKRIRKQKDELVVVISHRVVLNIIMLYLLGLDPKHFWDFHFDNASISEITIYENGKFQIIRTNDTHHLK
ncbi:MAG: histidine phosphatase family protein [Candidatus Heimdallarchaeota archaeon]|nr:histidine phosphatase family protein [Candidatus Heimdallarchaeota archaeon]